MTTPHTRDSWESLANGLKIRTQAFIDGNYVNAASGKTFDCISPIDGRSLGRVSECEAEDIERAVIASRRSFDSGAWSEAAPRHRKKVLLKFAGLIEQHGDELALLESLDMGKPVSDARAVDVAATIRCMAWTGEALDKVYGEASIMNVYGQPMLSLSPARELLSGNLEHWHYDTWKWNHADPFLEPGYVTFNFDADHNVTGFKIDLHSPDFHFYKLDFKKQ